MIVIVYCFRAERSKIYLYRIKQQSRCISKNIQTVLSVDEHNADAINVNMKTMSKRRLQQKTRKKDEKKEIPKTNA